MNLQFLNYLYVFLLTIGFMNILVIDDEMLVLLCWVLFVVLSYIYISNAINVLFVEDRVKLHKDMVFFNDLHVGALRALKNCHMIHVLTSFESAKLINFSRLKAAKFLDKRQVSFKFIIVSQIENKLFILLGKEATVAAQAQDSINLKISLKIFNLFKLKNKRVNNLKKKILGESIIKFKNIVDS
jgi:hypothetical protein